MAPKPSAFRGEPGDEEPLIPAKLAVAELAGSGDAARLARIKSKLPSLADLGSLSARSGSSTALPRIASNPLKMGVPKRVPSLNTQVEAKCRELGGERAIHSVLVANNGLAAVKFMRSVRSWAYKTFGNERAVALVAMATPEDMRIDAEHVRMADQFVEVPGGSNNNNYANVQLIVQVAERANVDAVWPGWGHASEKPELPEALAGLPSGVRFLGPPKAPMAALGDKIGSTILAQAAGVPTIPWSGSGVAVDFASCEGVIPDDVYQSACIHSLAQALECCRQIGYPVMLKASWGGGGKGIRKCMGEDDVRASYKQVLGEVPGSPVFAMKLAAASRHLEVQLLCDAHGGVTSLFSRDCSTQRRHQKIVEEGPVTKAPPETLKEMERCARALARSVRYVGAATVEYLFDLESGKYYFLELNPRLQVEHPVTEWISGVNIPSCQLLVGMGVPLHRIPDIRALFGKEPTGSSPIDFEADAQVAPNGHVVAVRVTSEDANDGFKPTCGSIDELSFPTSPDVWGYFSVKSGGGIHEFSDSQFGHLFAKADTREAAIRAMVVALKEVRIRGEIRTLLDYAVDMIQHPDFVGNAIHTGWLDARIASHVKAEKPAWHLGVIAGAVLRTMERAAGGCAEYLGYLQKGQLPPARLSLTSFREAIVLEGVKYSVDCVRRGPQEFRLQLGSVAVDCVGRKLNDGGLLIQVDGRTHVVHSEEEPLGTRLTIDSLTCLLANETDPSRLVAASPGKLVRCLAADGGRVVKDQPYAEIEVMKMVMTLLAPAAGRVRFQQLEGALLAAGDVIARLDLDDPAAVQSVVPCTGSFPELGPPLVHSSRSDARFKAAFAAAKNILQGFENSVAGVMEDLLASLDNPSLAMLQWDEVFSVVQTRLPPELAAALQDITADFEEGLAQQCLEPEAGGEQPGTPPGQPVFPSGPLLAAIQDAVQAAPPLERPALESQVESLVRVAKAHEGGKAAFARRVAEELFSDFLAVEERFACEGEATEQEVIDAMRREFSDSLGRVVDIVVSHQGLPTKVALVCQLMQSLVLPSPELYRPLLRRFAALGTGSGEAAACAKQLLEQSLLSELRAVVARALSGLEMFSGSQLSELDLLAPEVSLGAAAAEGARSDAERALVRSSTIMEGLYAGLGSGGALALDAKIRLLVEAPAAVEDALASLLDHHDATLQHRALVTYVKRVYYPHLVREPELCAGHDGCLQAFWLHAPLGESAAGPEAAGGVALSLALVLPGLAALPPALAAAERAIFDSVVGDCERSTLHVVLAGEGDELASAEAAVKQLAPQLADAGFTSVSVLGRRGALLPARLGFWREGAALVADPLLAAVEPAGAEALELRKLRGLGVGVAHHASRNRQCHTFAVTERRDARSLALRRVFARAVVRQLGKPALLAATYKNDAAGIAAAAVEEVEPSLINCLAELERLALASREQQALKADWTSVFLGVLPTLPLSAPRDEARVAHALKSACASLVSRHAQAMRRAAVAQVEIRLRVPDASGAWRLVVSSPTGHETGDDSVAVYRESPTSPPRYASKHGKSEEPGPLDGQPVAAPLAPLEGLQQKRLAARRHKTTYCYDFPSVFGTALRDIWTARAVAGEPGSMPAGPLVEVQELVLPPSGARQQPHMVPTDRPSGRNDVGVVAWLLTLKTPECPQGRQVVAVANDITFSSGAFGPREDAVFLAATEHALEERLPLVYLAANSGARVGLANEVKQRLQVEWVNPEDPTKGFKHLWLSDADYQAARGSVAATPVDEHGARRWVLSDVIGSEDGLGVECLSGSAAIAAAYSRAFREGLTLTLVSGRTVGIGAYLARLGRRCVQRADQPIILTGYAALNKLLGREVYTSHMQLGGPKVMGVNGVSHHVVADDLEGVATLLQWLGTMPPLVGGVPLPLPSADPTDRPVTYLPAAGEKLDPRAAIAGPGGLLDAGTWREASAGWARSVVTGRARLAGVPVGVIAVETATVMLNIPADPGAPDSAERQVPQPGQVWFPDSALKTAHALEEFDREGLPLLVLANWRGFSGGQRDLFEGVLQAGSQIVENLRTYRQPVFVYLPPGAELRGGAWVVIDGRINSQQVEMYADPGARGGVLEPEGIVEIKFRTPELLAAAHRLDPQLARLRQQGGPGMAAAVKAREAALLPVYRQVAVAFAEMHDTPVRMAAKGVLTGIVPWAQARAFLARRLKRRLAEEEILKHITTTDGSVARGAALELLRGWYLGGGRRMTGLSSVASPREAAADRPREPLPHEQAAWANDAAFLAWAEGAGAIVIASELKALRARAASRALVGLTASVEGRDGLLHGLAGVLRSDAALRAQIAALLAKQHASGEAATPRRNRPSQDGRRWSRDGSEPSTTASIGNGSAA